jgi:hypothetical protein
MVSRVRDAVAEMTRDGMAIRLVRSTIVPADESFLCLVNATSDELVRDAFTRAGISIARISSALSEEG